MQLLIHLAILLAINCLLVAAIGMLVGISGMVALNAGVLMAAGAYTYGIATTRFHMAPLGALLIAAAVGILIGWISGAAVMSLRDDDAVLGTLALQLVLTSLISNFDSLTGGIYGLPGIARLRIFSDSLSSTAAITLISAGVVLLGLLVLYQSPFARALRATRDAPIDAQLLGRDLKTLRRGSFACAGAAASIAGALLASYFRYLDPTTIDINVSIIVIAGVIVGGAGTLRGAILGAVLITIIPELLRFVPLTNRAAPALQQLLFGILLVVCIIHRPRGILGEYDLRGV